MDVLITVDPDPSVPALPRLSSSEFSCHCCYEVLLDPTTLTCGHSFCRHCLATWWASALRTDCPECRETWQGFPKVNILLRDTVEKLFPADVTRRKQAVHSDPRLCHVLLVFQQQDRREAPRAAPPENRPQINMRDFCAGLLVALGWVTMVLLVCRVFTADSSDQMLVIKPLSRWSTNDVTLWVKHLGVWTNQYREVFHREQIDGRALSTLMDEDLSAAPFTIENECHRRVILEELQRLRERRPSLTLWDYKEVSLGKTLFLLISLRCCPRLMLLYLFLFDYEDTFLPFIHTCCPATPDTPTDTPLDWLSWSQWAEFLLMYFLLPYQLLAAFAWQWAGVHYWTAGVVIVHCVLLSVLDVCFHWTLWRRREMRTLPQKTVHHVCAVMMNSCMFVLLWPLIPLVIVNLEIYIQLFIFPFVTAVLVKRTLLQTPMQHRP